MQVIIKKNLPFIIKNLPFVYKKHHFIRKQRVLCGKIIFYLLLKNNHLFQKNDKKSIKRIKYHSF